MALDFIIRPAERRDCVGIRDLIVELAIFEKMPGEVEVNVEDLIRDGFDIKPPLYRCIVAERREKVIGMALFYFIYSTWKGKCIYLEDLCVASDCRNYGVGSKLFDAVVKVGLEENCQRFDFEVLKWNPARRFYDRKGAVNITETEDWHKHRISRQQMEDIIHGSSE